MVDAMPPQPPSLLVFSDDWGRHPSSCQHLIRELLPRHPVCWVNTIGTRTPKFDRETLHRAWGKLSQWRTRSAARDARAADSSSLSTTAASPRPIVLNPRMWPWFTRRIDRALNRRLLERQLRGAVEQLPQPVVAVTTLPITADLIGNLPVASWVYYCVDDFREWPGLDGHTLGRMEEDLVQRADQIIVVSETLRTRMTELGRDAHLLTHGCDVDFFAPAAATPSAPHSHFAGLEPPFHLFWGVIDRRMDVAFLETLSRRLTRGTIVLVGPQQNPDPVLAAIPRVVLRPAVPMPQLPALAAAASVLIMPYADLPVTRAMQPLKLKEYLATGKPAVVRNLPAVTEWTDALDAVMTPDHFAERVIVRAGTGLPESQRVARLRLAGESWSAKAAQLEQWIEALVLGLQSPAHRPTESAQTNEAPRLHATSPAAEGLFA